MTCQELYLPLWTQSPPGYVVLLFWEPGIRKIGGPWKWDINSLTPSAMILWCGILITKLLKPWHQVTACAWVTGAVEPISTIPLSPPRWCFLLCFWERVCTQSMCGLLPPPPLLVCQSSNQRWLHSWAHPFFQTVAGRGEFILLSSISCSIAPVSQIKALSLPLFALNFWRARQPNTFKDLQL